MNQRHKNDYERRQRRKEHLSVACNRFEQILKDNKILFVDLKHAANFENSGFWWPRYEAFYTEGYSSEYSIGRVRFYMWAQDSFYKIEECPRGYIKDLELPMLLNNISQNDRSRSFLVVYARLEDQWAIKPITFLNGYYTAVIKDKGKKEQWRSLKKHIRLVPITQKEVEVVNKKYNKNIKISSVQPRKDPMGPPFYHALGPMQIKHENLCMIEIDEFMSEIIKYTDYDPGWRVRFKAGINILYRIGDLWR